MKKIPFSNNGEPAINDTNLNLMQDYIETAIQGSVGGDTLPIGAIMPFGGGTVPDNYLLCDGQAVSRTEYATLFQTIGTAFGVGDGSTTFNVPNLKGRVPVGVDTTQTEFDTLGETGGEKTHTLTANEMPRHNHMVYDAVGGNITFPAYTAKSNGSTGGSETTAYAAVTTYAGGDQPHNILQPYQTTNYIIKAFQTAGVVASVVNAHSDSTTNVYSASYVNGLNTYSTTEKRIGTWIDNKPLYRKVVYCGALLNNDTKVTEHGITNLKMIRSMEAFSNSSQGGGIPIPHAVPNSEVFIWIDYTYVRIQSRSDRTQYTNTYVTLEYTKTTD